MQDVDVVSTYLQMTSTSSTIDFLIIAEFLPLLGAGAAGGAFYFCDCVDVAALDCLPPAVRTDFP